MKKELSIDQFKGYFYLYSPFVDENSKFYDNFKQLKKRPHFYTFLYSHDLKKTLKKIQFKETQSFSYCKTGFQKYQIRIRLSNFPLYDSDKDEKGFIPSDISGLKSCYINSADFFNWENKRVKIIIDDDVKFHSYEKYVNFDDIHKIRKDLYVKDMILLGNIEEPILDSIDFLDHEIKSTLKTELKNKKYKYLNFADHSSNNVRKAIANIACNYALTHSLKRKFHVHRPQLYAVLKSVELLLSKFKSKNDDINSNSIENIISYNLKSLITDPSLSEKMRGLIAKGLMANINTISMERILDENSNKKKSNTHYVLNHFTKVNNNPESKSRGIVFQVETGEGKSCIISLIAAILALNKKTVHITSSNIKLANRDYIESFDFYKKLGIKSAVFLHDNELPYTIKKNSNKLEPNDDTNEEQELKEMESEEQESKDNISEVQELKDGCL